MTPALSAQIDEAERLAQPRGDSMQVSRDVGELLAAIAVAHRAKLIVEIGTSYGFSGLWWSAALALHNGHLHTIDVLDKKYSAAKSAFSAAGVADRVTSTWATPARSSPRSQAPSTWHSSTPTNPARKPTSTCSGPKSASAALSSRTTSPRTSRKWRLSSPACACETMRIP